MAEGAELLATAMAAGILPEAVFYTPGGEAAAGLAAARGVRAYELATGVMERISDTVTPQPVLAVFAIADQPAEVLAGGSLVVVMVDVRDPGNAGTVLRTADAVGADGVVCCGGTVDPYNPKTVRSSAGSIFHVPVVLAPDPSGALDELGELGFRRVGTAVRGGTDYASANWRRPTALVLGNESAGLRPGLPLDEVISIPMAGAAESLNVGMASAVLCFEAVRQRRSTMH